MLDDERFVTFGGRRMLRVRGGEAPPEGGDPQDGGDPPAGGGDKTFTQAEVDRIISDRLARQKNQFSDYEDLKQKATRLDELETENQSEIERAQNEAKKAADERDTERQAREQATERANRALVRSAVVLEAAKQNAVDPDAVVSLLPQDAVTVGDDGQVTGAEDAVKALLEQKQYLVGQPRPGPGGGGPRTSAPAPDLDEQIAEAERKGDVRTSIALKTQKAAQGA